MTRQRLPNRRSSTTLTIADPDPRSPLLYDLSLGHDEAGRIKEAFVSCHKATSGSDIAARDCAILISIALQHGATLEELASAMCRDDHGEAQGIAGAALDAVLALRGRPHPTSAPHDPAPTPPPAPVAAAAPEPVAVNPWADLDIPAFLDRRGTVAATGAQA